MIIKRILRKYLSPWLWGFTQHELLLAKVSWAQHAEDLLLEILFENKAAGTYVDIGAYDAVNCSNTYSFYRRGWHGIVIDANPDAESSFRKFRPRDTFINCAVGQNDSRIEFNKFPNGLFNCSSENLDFVPQELRNKAEKIEVQCYRLSTLLSEHKAVEFDLLSIDCEGEDLNILESNDWSICKPYVICVEDHSSNWSDSKISQYLFALGYVIKYRAGPTSIFRLGD